MIGTTRARRLSVIFALLIISGLSVSQAMRALGHKAARGASLPVANFTLFETEHGKPMTLDDFRAKPVVVLAFLGIDCPVGELYLPRLSEMSREWKARGVVFLGVNSNALESAAEVAEHAHQNRVPFLLLKDPGNVLADRLQVERQCEVVVLDSRRRVRYRGAIDDQYQVGKRKETADHPYLAEAIAALLDGREVPVPQTTVFGCLIERARPQPGTAASRSRRQGPVASHERWDVGQVTFSEHVAPILQEKCQSCHRPRQVGPFPLLTYENARRRASMIREVVDDQRMPPWHADPNFGHFENDRRLTPRQRATLLAWVDQGAPRGDAAREPPPRKFPEGWGIGSPDLVIPMSEPYTVAAEGVIPYQRFRVSTGFTEDKWVQAAEIRPGDAGVVHHVFVFIEKHSAHPKNHKRFGPVLAGYAPGDMPSIFPVGTARRVPAGSDLLFEIHYTPTGRERTDRTSVGLIFANGPVAHEAITTGVRPPGPPAGRLNIPPGALNYEARGAHVFTNDAHLLSLMPHMHLRGKDFRYTVTYPDGRSEILLSVPAYDFAWQSVYRLAEPKSLPQGTRIDCLAHFDNSAANPANPDPSATVRWGDYTWDEMMIGYLDYYLDHPSQGATPSSEPE